MKTDTPSFDDLVKQAEELLAHCIALEDYGDTSVNLCKAAQRLANDLRNHTEKTKTDEATVEFPFVLGQKVMLDSAAIVGRIDALYVDRDGIQWAYVPFADANGVIFRNAYRCSDLRARLDK